MRIGFGDAAVTVTITYYYGSPSSTAFAAFNEQITLRVLQRLQDDGIQLAPTGHAAHSDGGSAEHSTHQMHEAGHESHEAGHESHGAGHGTHEPAPGAPGHSAHQS